MNDVRAYLAGLDGEALVDLVMTQAMNDDRLRQQLLMKAARKGPGGLDLATYRRAIDRAVDAGDFVEYGEARGYARGIDDAIDGIEELLGEGHAAEAIGLTEHALSAVERSMESVDDSDGAMGGILQRLQEIHHSACAKAAPDPEELATRLFEWELRTDWDTFFGAADTYADVLGEKGLAIYRQLAEAEWARVPALKAGEDDPSKYGSRFRITHIMEALACQSGDVEALVAVKERDLSSAYAYLEIAEVYLKAGQHDRALSWGERGLEAFPSRTDSRLRKFVATEYHRRKRHDEAMVIAWAEFADSPDLERLQRLKAHADRTGQWPVWRDKGLAYVREQVERVKREAQRSRWRWPGHGDHSELVRIFLWEKDVDAAWSEAKAGGCSSALWRELAARREKAFPADALAVYQQQIEPVLAAKNNDAYADAVGLLRKVRGLMVRLGRRPDFVQYLGAVRAAHKSKRNFMKLLDQARWEDLA